MCIEKYGNENFRNIAKSKQTKLEKYGNENFNNRDEAKKTMLKKYGVDNVSKHDEIKQKKQTTFIHRQIDNNRRSFHLIATIEGI